MNLSGIFAYMAHFFKTKIHFAFADFEKEIKKYINRVVLIYQITYFTLSLAGHKYIMKNCYFHRELFEF